MGMIGVATTTTGRTTHHHHRLNTQWVLDSPRHPSHLRGSSHPWRHRRPYSFKRSGWGLQEVRLLLAAHWGGPGSTTFRCHHSQQLLRAPLLRYLVCTRVTSRFLREPYPPGQYPLRPPRVQDLPRRGFHLERVAWERRTGSPQHKLRDLRRAPGPALARGPVITSPGPKGDRRLPQMRGLQ